MSQPKHTPGPWKKCSNGMVNCKSGLIAAVYSGQSYVERPEDDGMMEANTAIIAAAPDLLALLKETAAAIDKEMGIFPDNESGPDTLRARVYRCIAKAEGRA